MIGRAREDKCSLISPFIDTILEIAKYRYPAVVPRGLNDSLIIKLDRQNPGLESELPVVLDCGITQMPPRDKLIVITDLTPDVGVGVPDREELGLSFRRSGTLWEGRYTASLVDCERYVLTCYRYIELNPVRAGDGLGPG